MVQKLPPREPESARRAGQHATGHKLNSNCHILNKKVWNWSTNSFGNWSSEMRQQQQLAPALKFRFAAPYRGIGQARMHPLPRHTSNTVIDALPCMAREPGATVGLGIVSRGFLLGPAVARAAGLGFVAVRKSGGSPTRRCPDREHQA